MMTAIALLFYVAVAWLLYVFIAYPLLMALLAKLRPRPLRLAAAESGALPSVTIVMAAYNEERLIAAKLQNYLELDYPRELLTFFIGSDGSTDRTDAIIQEFISKDSSIQLHRFHRSGKTQIVYQLADQARSELILFTDADALFTPDALAIITRCFTDPDVGGVVARVVPVDEAINAGNRGERSYLGMEERLRANESLVWSTVGPTGQCFAVRRGGYDHLHDYRLSDDTHLVINIPRRPNGKRVWFQPSLLVREMNRRTLWSETRRRLRMGQQAAATFLAYPGTRFPWRSWIGFQIWSHKLLRHLSSIPAVLVFLTSLPLALVCGGVGYQVVAGFAVAWFLAVAVGLLLERLRMNIAVVQYPTYFTLMLLGLTIGCMRTVLRGGGLAMWTSPRLEE